MYDFLSLLNHIAVLMILAYLMTRTKRYSQIVINGLIGWKSRATLILWFGLFSIYGTLNSVAVFNLPINFRDIGPIIGGLIGGPIVGVGAGIMGGFHRYFYMTTPTDLGCSIMAVAAGLTAGIVYLALKGRSISYIGAIVLTVCIETVHFVMTIAILGFPDYTLDFTSNAYLPMILSNSIGVALFFFINRNLISEKNAEIEKEKYENELSIAANIQKSMLPEPANNDSQFDLAATVIPARAVGGDLYDYFLLGDQLCLVIGDVSGKGIPAALFMVRSISTVRAAAQSLFQTNGRINPSETLALVNQELCKNNSEVMFITLMFAVVDFHKNEIVIANAGHNLPYHISTNNQVEEICVKPTPPIGIREKANFTNHTISLDSCKTLLFYTDGVTEAENAHEIPYTKLSLERKIIEFKDLLPQDIVKNIILDLTVFTKGTNQFDDITMLCVKFK